MIKCEIFRKMPDGKCHPVDKFEVESPKKLKEEALKYSRESRDSGSKCDPFLIFQYSHNGNTVYGLPKGSEIIWQ